MRRIPKIYEPVIDAAIGRIAGQRHVSKYVCKRCLRHGSSSQLPPTSTARFSTSAASSAALGMDKFSSAMKGETSMFDGKAEQNETDFKPAETWEGLEWVGTRQWYEQQKRPSKPFQGYGRITAPLKDRIKIRDELLKAIVEVFTIKKAAPDAWKTRLRQATVDDAELFPRGIRIGSDPHTKELVLEFENGEVEKQFSDHLQRTINSESQRAREEISDTGSSTAEAAQATQSSSEDFAFADLRSESYGKWSSISLEDLGVRFAIARRVQQRTGIRLTDPQFTHATTAGAMFNHLWKPEKPKKLAERLMSNEELANLPNVKIADHRITFVHREREVGRWKVIEEELNERGIPALGTPGFKKRSGKV
ncbi:uncharacterized protein PV09_01394 [Verruconis gallopava]|uniref:Large ribosomal subunit protein mL50 n=1 Tax=Verruconis gallopava TaxID=253628 RepID=A0A0D2BB75_9PEZI|nr:uncharacterized protein PV09_01394 [Verruconis gallopava]KIW08499.1 hypothetical protein PV09_01394 [Verruconis gallopava]